MSVASWPGLQEPNLGPIRLQTYVGRLAALLFFASCFIDSTAPTASNNHFPFVDLMLASLIIEQFHGLAVGRDPQLVSLLACL